MFYQSLHDNFCKLDWQEVFADISFKAVFLRVTFVCVECRSLCLTWCRVMSVERAIFTVQRLARTYICSSSYSARERRTYSKLFTIVHISSVVLF